jgi:hypothetical protein
MEQRQRTRLCKLSKGLASRGTRLLLLLLLRRTTLCWHHSATGLLRRECQLLLLLLLLLLQQLLLEQRQVCQRLAVALLQLLHRQLLLLRPHTQDCQVGCCCCCAPRVSAWLGLPKQLVSSTISPQGRARCKDVLQRSKAAGQVVAVATRMQ